MKKNRIYISIFIFCSAIAVQAQDTANDYGFDFKKLKPIVQVFGTAAYNIENSQFAYYIGRAHLGFEYSFNDNWSSKIVLDRGRPTTFGDLIITDSTGSQLNVDWTYSEGAYYTMYLKFASLRWKVNKNFIIEGGAILQNHFITQEKFWGFRYVAQTFQDLYWRIPSTDLGFIAYYTIDKHFSLDVALTNGEGPRINQDDIGNIKIAGGFNIDPCDKLKTRLYYHYRETKNSGGASTEQLFSFFAGYKPFVRGRIGGEINVVTNFQGVKDMNSYGYSIYGAYEVISKTEVFARFDRVLFVLPEQIQTSTFNNGSALIGGISYSPVKGVFLSLNYQAFIPDGKENKIKSRVTLGMEYKF